MCWAIRTAPYVSLLKLPEVAFAALFSTANPLRASLPGPESSIVAVGDHLDCALERERPKDWVALKEFCL